MTAAEHLPHPAGPQRLFEPVIPDLQTVSRAPQHHLGLKAGQVICGDERAGQGPGGAWRSSQLLAQHLPWDQLEFEKAAGEVPQ